MSDSRWHAHPARVVHGRDARGTLSIDSRFDKESFRFILKWFDGTWRSLVARTLGVREVASSNLAVPTIKKRLSDFRRKAFKFFWQPRTVSVGSQTQAGWCC